MIQTALVWKCHKLLQIFSVSKFCVQPQEGAVYLCSAHHVLPRPPDSFEKIPKEGQVMMKCVSVLLPEYLEVPASRDSINLRLKVLAETRLHVRVEADDFSGVQLTFTVQVGNEY